MKVTTRKLSDVVFFQEGPGVRKFQFRNEGVKLLNVGNINKGKLNTTTTKLFISNEEAYGKYKHFLVDEGDLLIASSGIVVSNFHNKIAYARKEHLPLCLNTSTIRFKSLDKNIFNLDYLKFYLKTSHFKNQLNKLITGAAQLNFGPSHLNKIILPIPSIKDQIQIANILSKAETLIEQRKQSIALLDELLKSSFLEMFGDNVNNDKDWKQIKLIEACSNKNDVKCGPFGTQLSKSEYQTEGIPVWGIPQINSLFKILPKEFLTKEKVLELESYSVIPFDIVMSRKGNVGKCSLFPKGFSKGIIHSDVLRIRTDKKIIHPIFLLFQLKYSQFVESQIKGVTKGAIMAGINVGMLKHILIHQPPIELHIQFAHLVEKIETLKEQYKNSLQELENLYGVLSQQAFKGELVSKKSDAKVIALAPETKLAQPELNKQQAFLRKLMLASHIIYELCEESTFGHTKLMKLLYLSEQAGGMALQTNYKKFAAGPFDGKMLTLLDQEFVKNKWFGIEKKTFTISGKQREATVYKKTEKSLLYKKHFDNYFESEAETINRIIELFRKEKTQTAEIVATLYFAWKELVTANIMISEDSLVKGFYQFHQEKKKFTKEQILMGYNYMKENEIYPLA